MAAVKGQQRSGGGWLADLVHEVAWQVEVIVDRRIARALAEIRAQLLRQCAQARLGA